MANAEDEILTLDEVAAHLKAGKRTIYRLVAAKKIPAFKVGGTWRFSRAETSTVGLSSSRWGGLDPGRDGDNTADGKKMMESVSNAWTDSAG